MLLLFATEEKLDEMQTFCLKRLFLHFYTFFVVTSFMALCMFAFAFFFCLYHHHVCLTRAMNGKFTSRGISKVLFYSSVSIYVKQPNVLYERTLIKSSALLGTFFSYGFMVEHVTLVSST